MAIIYDMLELDGLPGAGDTVGVPGTGSDVEFLMTETQADVPDDYFSVNLNQMIEAGFHVGSLGTWPAEIDGNFYSTNGLYEATFNLGGTSYDGFIVQATPLGGGPDRFFLIPEDGVSPLSINQLTITSTTSVMFIDADDASTDDTINFVVCFAAGTRLHTPSGPRRVEELVPGDAVTTLDDGAQPVLWSAETTVPLASAIDDPQLCPVEITAGALAPGLPHRPLRVSRQHRLLLRSRIAQRMFGAPEVLVPAKDLLDLPGVRVLPPVAELRYVHLLLPRHAVLLAEGVGAESLWLGAEAARFLGPAQVAHARHMLYAQQDPARPFVSGRRARSLVARHIRNRRNFSAETQKAPGTSRVPAPSVQE